MACFSASHVSTDLLSPTRTISWERHKAAASVKPLLVSSSERSGTGKNSLFLQAARLFVPATRFEASKLKVVFLGEMEKHPKTIPRIYTVTHCDLTANLTLAISDAINIDQVLKALIHGDSVLFSEQPELMEACVWLYFHSNLKKYNRMECWGPLKDAAEGRHGDVGQQDSYVSMGGEVPKEWMSPRSIFQSLVAFLL